MKTKINQVSPSIPNSSAEPDGANSISHKKPYMKPAILFSSPLEAMAGFCGGGSGKQEGSCTYPINS